MLQPVQLADVSNRYAGEIAELRDFLSKAGCAVETASALGQIAGRLARDRGFHRDLSSCIWVVLDRCQGISYSDLLGVLALAAAGSSFAALAEEDDAHHLLRFLMDARHSLDALSGKQGPAPETAAPISLPPAPFLRPVPGREQAASVAPPLDGEERSLFARDVPQHPESRRRGYLWVVAAACLLLATMFSVWWLKIRPSEYAANSEPTVSPAPSSSVSPTPRTQESAPLSAPVPEERNDRVASANVPHGNPNKNSRAMRPSPASRSSARMPAPAPYIPAPAASAPPPLTASATRTPAPVPPTPAPITRPQDSSTAPAPVTRTAGNSGPTQVGPHGGPSSAPAPTQNVAHPQDATPQNSSDISRIVKPQIILHRRETGSSPGQDGTEFALATPAPAVRSSAPTPTPAASAPAAPVGVVRLTSLGIMASNLVYSPLPAYPAAASAAHVEGQVKVSADVDRDGKVAAVRVISGPPQLRAAALDAVQRWRYRPYSASSASATRGAIEVLEFQLP